MSGRPVTRTMREVRGQLRTVALMLALAVLGLGIGAYLVVHQRIQWPGWVPFVGQHHFILNSEVTAVSGVLPGQGQAVTISGVTVGQISGVTLRQGVPVVTMQIDPQYGDRIYPNATVLLRPKTGLSDMVAQLDPGSRSSGQHLRSGATLTTGRTLPTVQFDEILAQLDTDTRAELMSFVADGGQALSNGGGHELANVFRRFDPLSRDVKTASELVAQRGAELQRLMGNLAKIATTLGDNESAITAFVQGNEGVWREFARQDQSLRQTLGLLPPALQSANGALSQATVLGNTLHSALGQLLPSARALGPTLSDLRQFFNQTTPVLRDQLRPFSVAAQPTARLLAPATSKLAAATPGLTTLARELNNILNELAFKPKGQQGYLFYVPWANHNSNSVLSGQDGVGPVRQSMLKFSCGTLSLLPAVLKHNPTLATLIELLNVPDASKYCNGSLPK